MKRSSPKWSSSFIDTTEIMQYFRARKYKWILCFSLFCAVMVFSTMRAQRSFEAAEVIHSYGSFADARAMSLTLDGIIVIVDAGNEAVIEMAASGEILRMLSGRGWGNLEFDQPADVDAVQPLRIFIADYGNNRIQIFDKNLNYVSTITGTYPDPASPIFRYPRSLAVSRHNDIFILDGDNARIIKMNATGALTATFGGFDAGMGRLLHPIRVRASLTDVLAVVDGNDLIFFDLYGNFLSRYHNTEKISSCSFDVSTSQWICASDSSVTILRLDGTEWHEQQTIVLPVPEYNQQHDHVIIDCVYRNNRIYILTAHQVIIFDLHPPKE